MDVHLVILGRIEVYYGGDVVHMDATCSNVACDQRVYFAAGEISECSSALVLAAPSMDRN
jgi:hypothetical protein